MTINLMSAWLRQFGYSVKINALSLIVSRNSEDISKQDIYDLFSYQDRSKVTDIKLLRHTNDDSFDRVAIYF